MRITAFLFISILVLFKPALAQDWPSAEVKIACPPFVQEILSDKTFAYYGCGEREKTGAKTSGTEVGNEIIQLEKIVQGNSLQNDLLNFYLRSLEEVANRSEANRRGEYLSSYYTDEREADLDDLNQKIGESLFKLAEILAVLDFLSFLPAHTKVLELEAKLFYKLFGMLEEKEAKQEIFDQAHNIAKLLPVFQNEDGSFRNHWTLHENGYGGGGFRDKVLSNLLDIAQAASRNGILAHKLLEMLETKGLELQGKEHIQ